MRWTYSTKKVRFKRLLIIRAKRSSPAWLWIRKSRGSVILIKRWRIYVDLAHVMTVAESVCSTSSWILPWWVARLHHLIVQTILDYHLSGISRTQELWEHHRGRGHPGSRYLCHLSRSQWAITGWVQWFAKCKLRQPWAEGHWTVKRI